MDFLDPKKQRRHKIVLICGYLLIACLVAGATTVLLYESYGFGLGKGGSIIQNGLIYLSSQPSPANIKLNNSFLGKTTNTSLTLPEGIYNIQLSRTGYRTWNRKIEVDGGMIEDYTYPLLVPTKLSTSNVKTYSAQPALATESPNRHWLLIEQPGSSTNFDLYDLTNPAADPSQISVPVNVISKPATTESWVVVAWANDNSHILLDHTFDGKTEYVLFDVSDPSQSINLSQALNSVSFTSITLRNQHYDQYYLYNGSNGTLMSDNLSAPNTPTTVLSNVITYNTYGASTILYATTNGAAAGKVDIDELNGSTNYHIKTFDAGSTYLLDMAGYKDTLYVVAGSAALNKVYIYENPVGQLSADSDQAPVPAQVLFVNNPTYVSFSDTAQFVVAESAQQFAVYNIENSSGYNYQTNLPLDSPQTSASWMDGDRLTYVSGGKLSTFEYDHNYQQTLMPASPSYLPFFTPSYTYVYSLTPAPNGTSYLLTRTSLYTSADQPQKL